MELTPFSLPVAYYRVLSHREQAVNLLATGCELL
jgi:hypothetical protein